jgi:hypothetical protein
MTVAFRADRNPMVVYSAWLCDVSSTRISIFPVYLGAAGCSETVSLQRNAPG